eukprot:gene19755-29964_t
MMLYREYCRKTGSSGSRIVDRNGDSDYPMHVVTSSPPFGSGGEEDSGGIRGSYNTGRNRLGGNVAAGRGGSPT